MSGIDTRDMYPDMAVSAMTIASPDRVAVTSVADISYTHKTLTRTPFNRKPLIGQCAHCSTNAFFHS